MKILDMQGQPCPMPVVEAKKSLAAENVSSVAVLVDNRIAVQNLEKMAKGSGYGFSFEGDGALYKVIISKNANNSQNNSQIEDEPLQSGTGKEKGALGPVVLITSNQMGRSAEDLGKLLIKGFIFSLANVSPPPEAVIFLNSGAYLTTEGANTVPDLKELENKGTKIYTCGTCANYFKLTESLAVGSIADMMTITNLLVKASGTITI